MSRRDEQSDIYRRPRRDRNYDDELEVDISRQRYPERRAETVVKERDSVVSRGPRQPDFLREDYGKTTAGQLVLREDFREEDVYRRSPAPRSRAPPERVEKVIFEERERGPPYPRSQRSDVGEREEVIYRERTRSRPPPPREPPREEREEIDITIRERERSRPPPPRSEAPVEEIRFRRGGGPPRTVERTDVEIRETRSPAPRPPREVVEREEIDIREVRSPPRRGRDTFKEEIRIRESSAPPPKPRSPSQGTLVARKDEEWVVRRPRRSPPRDYEKEEIIIRRREKTPEPEPEPESESSSSSDEEPEPEPEPTPPPQEPKYLPPIIQEIITHHRHIDHPIQRAKEEEKEEKDEKKEEKKEEKKDDKKDKKKEKRREDHLELEIRRKGTRNGKPYEEDFTFEEDRYEGSEEDDSKSTKRSHSVSARSASQAPVRRRYEDEYEDEIAAEADYYNSKIASRAYPGEAYNGATKDWALVDVPPGTERVRMDGVGGGRQEITWQRYNGERRGRFVSGDRAYEAEFGNGYAPQPQLSPAPAPPEPPREIKEEIRITKSRKESQPPPRKRDRMWTEVTKDLVIKEAIEEQGYEYEETDGHFYIIEYLRYVSCSVRSLLCEC